MFAEEVNIIPKLPGNLQASLGSSKWKERKEVLDELLTLVNATQRIQDVPELGELSRSLAHCIHKDANINCVMTAANCLEGLAKGVMSSFGRYHEALIPPMLERMKERKATVTDAIGAAMDAIFLTVCSRYRCNLWYLTTFSRHHCRMSRTTSSQLSAQRILRSRRARSSSSPDV